MVRRRQEAEDRAGKQELEPRGERARAMPTAPAVKELLAARAQRGDDVLEVRRRSCNRTEGRGIERTPPHGEKRDRGSPARHFEAAAGDVLMWNAVCGQVQDRPEQKRARRRADCRSDRGTSRNVQRNNHSAADRSFIREGTRLPLITVS
jgi:hypothetical protein